MANYYRGTLDSRTGWGRLARELQGKYARHCGHDDFESCPITLQDKIRLLIGNWIFLMSFMPEPGSKTGGRELRSSENTVNRILSELGLRSPEKPAQTLHEIAARIVEEGGQ